MLTGAPAEGGKRDLSLGFCLSVLLHATLLPLLLWLALFRTPLRFVPPPAQQPERLEIQSSAVRIEHKARPLPPAITRQKPTPVRIAQPIQARQPLPRRVVAVLVPKGPPAPVKPRKLTLSDELAMQEQQFARTAAKLRSENNPLSVATSLPVPSTLHRSYADTEGVAQQQERYYAVLVPTQHWFHGNFSCYYTTYHTQFGNGGSEDGTIPWPVCYPRNADRMLPLDHPHELPVPYPPPGWKLPSETYITPWLENIYDGSP